MKANIERAIDNFYLEQEKFEHYYEKLDEIAEVEETTFYNSWYFEDSFSEWKL